LHVSLSFIQDLHKKETILKEVFALLKMLLEHPSLRGVVDLEKLTAAGMKKAIKKGQVLLLTSTDTAIRLLLSVLDIWTFDGSSLAPKLCILSTGKSQHPQNTVFIHLS
jgi:hypothetical protein